MSLILLCLLFNQGQDSDALASSSDDDSSLELLDISTASNSAMVYYNTMPFII